MITKKTKLLSATVKPDAFHQIEVCFIKEIFEDGKLIASSKHRSVMTPDNYQDTKINPFGEVMDMPIELKKLQGLYTAEVRSKYNAFKHDMLL